ncbi:MAG: fibronectin type III domain-containing protein, partial [Huintestinicola sp.]
KSNYSTSNVKYATPSAPVTRPALPSFSVSAGNGQITASWNAVSGAKEYIVYTYLNGKFNRIGTTTSTKYIITGLKNGTKYGVLILAQNSAGKSNYSTSNVKYATPSAPVAKPALPNFSLTPGNGQITASWNAVSGAKEYIVYTYLNGKYTRRATTTSTKYTITGLNNGTKYGVLILSQNSAGKCAYTVNSVKYATPTASGAVPSLPSGVVLYAADSSIDVSWNSVSNIQYYSIYLYHNNTYKKIGITKNTFFTIPSLSNGIEYGVLVLATNTAGSSAFSFSDVKFATPKATGGRPSLPTGLSVTPGNTTIRATWNAVSNASYYVVYLYYNNQLSELGMLNSSYTSCNIKGLKNNTKYGVIVLAKNSLGTSVFSSSNIKYATPSAVYSSVKTSASDGAAEIVEAEDAENVFTLS